MNNGILVIVYEDVVGLQGHHSTLHLKVSGAVEVPVIISDDKPVTTSRKSQMFSSSAFIPPSSNAPNFYHFHFSKDIYQAYSNIINYSFSV